MKMDMNIYNHSMKLVLHPPFVDSTSEGLWGFLKVIMDSVAKICLD